MVDQDQEMTQREREIERMISGLIHDLRTKVSIQTEISHYLLGGLWGNFNESQKEMLTMAEKSGVECMKMINYLMEFYKTMDAAYHPNTSRLNIYPVIDQSLGRFVGRKSVDKDFFVDDAEYSGHLDGEVFVDADEFLTGRVLDNLISNAAKYARGRVGVTVSQDTDDATVCVSDDGEGIHPKYQDQIFQPYPDFRHTEQTGYRLGLYTARRLVEAQKGRIWFESNLRGSKFYFSLPLHKD